MRVLELHASMRAVKRSEGRSSVQMSAYITRTSMEDERTGEMHDFGYKGGVEFSGLVAHDNAPEWALDPRRLWNEVERSSKRKDAQVAREIEISMPYEFTAEQRREASMKIAHMLIRRYGGAAEYALHEPGADSDSRNYHGHFLFTARRFDQNGKWAAKGRMVKPEELPEGYERAARAKPRFIPDCPLDDVKRGPVEVENLRAEIAAIQNEIAVREKHQIFIEHLSFARRGMDKEATQHRGKNATAIERRGEVTEIGTRNRDIAARNEERAQARKEVKVIQIDLAKEKLTQKRSPSPAPPRTEDEEFAAFYKEFYDRRAVIVEALELEHGTREKELRRELAGLASSMGNAGLFTRVWRGVTGRTRADREQMANTARALEDIRRQRQTAHEDFEVERQERLEALKEMQRQREAELQGDAAAMARAVGDARVTAQQASVEVRSVPQVPSIGTPAAPSVPGGGREARRREYFRRLGAQRKAERERKPPAKAPELAKTPTEALRPAPAPTSEVMAVVRPESPVEPVQSPKPPSPAPDPAPASGPDYEARRKVFFARTRKHRAEAESSEVTADPAVGKESPAPHTPANDAPKPRPDYEARRDAYFARSRRQRERSPERDTGPTHEPG